ncbi:MAG: replication protein [Deltaproteobacteria bacterium]|nr:replication protein [Deltaproteobacteria bacterium]
MADKVPFHGFQSPNYTQVPDELFDELLATLSGAELKVLLYIIRRTFGFKKISDNISLSQITDGIVTNDGKRLDSGTGLVKSTAALALKGLVDRCIIVKVRNQTPARGDVATTYALNLIKVPVQKSDPPVSENQTPPGQKIGHAGGRKSDTQETVTNKQINEVVNAVTANDHMTTPRTRKPIISDRALRTKYELTDEQIGRVHWLVEKQTEVLGAADRNHSHYVKRAAEAVRDGNGEFFDHMLGDFKQAATEIAVGSRPAYFHAMYSEALQNRHAETAVPSSTTPPHRTRTAGEPQRLGETFGDLFRDSKSNQPEDTRGRMIADAEQRGFPVPDYIRSADLRAVNRWWASLPEPAPPKWP